MTSLTRKPVPRGLALPLVLTVIVILFLLGVAVAALSVGNARLVSNAQEVALARQAALGAIAEVQNQLNVAAPPASVNLGPTEVSVDPPVRYQVSASQRADGSYDVTAAGWIQAGTSERNRITMVARLARGGPAFRYPVQTTEDVVLSQTQLTGATGDIAIRTNHTGTPAVRLPGGSTVSGDILVGPKGNPATLVTPVPPSPSAVEAAGTSASIVVAPSPSALPAQAGLDGKGNVTLPTSTPAAP